MRINKYQPHILVLPEDDADRQLANGFHMKLASIRKMQVLPVAGGWLEVLSLFKSDHIVEMTRYPYRFMVLLIDFDGHPARLTTAKAAIPDDLADRVFILGVWEEPEDLKTDLGVSYETIGSALAQECRDDSYTIRGWEHPLLLHNASELERLREYIRPILFSSI